MLTGRHRCDRHLRAASHTRPDRLIRQPATRPQHTNQVLTVWTWRLTPALLGDRPDRTELGPGNPQVLTRHLREDLGRHLHVIQGDIAHRQQSSPYGLLS